MLFRRKPWLWVVVGLGFWALLLLVWSGVSELNATECYLAYTAERLDWGYVDHGLLSPVWAAAGQAMGGETTLGVRLFFILMQTSALGLFYTVVRRGVARSQEPLLAISYFLVAFSQPLLQLYGLMASDETTLFCGAVLLLWAVDGLLRSRSWVWALAIGGAWAWVGSTTLYSLFLMGAVLFSLGLMRPRRLFDWRVWMGILIGSAMLLPTLVWQMEQGWPVVDHFFDPRDGKGLFGAVAAWFIVFNPLWVVPSAVLSVSAWRGVMMPVEVTLRVLLFTTTAVMLYGGMAGAPSGVWVMPAVLSMLYLLPRWAVRRPMAKRYVLFVGGVGTLVVAFFVGVLIVTPSLHPFLGMSGNERRSLEWVDTLAAHGVDRVILEGDALGSSVLHRYGKGLESVALSSVYGRANQYTNRVSYHPWVDRTVAVELRSGVVDSVYQQIELDLSAPRRTVRLAIVPHFAPLYQMQVSVETVPAKVLTSSRIALLFWVTNPYDQERAIGGQSANVLLMHFRSVATGAVTDVLVPITAQTIPARQRVMVPSTVGMPQVATGEYRLSFSIGHPPLSSQSVGAPRTIYMVNPKSRI